MTNKSVADCVSIAMVQTPPLPGSFQYKGQSFDEILDSVLSEAAILNELGFDSLILQNMGDMPNRQESRPEAIAFMTIIAKEIKRCFIKRPLGILVNWDGIASLAVAEATGADFIRVEHVYTGVEVISTGLITAQCYDITDMKKRIDSDVSIFADVYEPHGIPLGAKSIEDAAWESIYEAFADGLFISGKSVNESIELVDCARKKVPNATIFLGGGANADNVTQLLKHFDGVCVATWIKNGNLRNPIDKEKAKLFIDKVEDAKIRKSVR